MGARVWPQVQTRPIDISFSFDVPSLLFIRLRGWYRILRFSSHDDIITAFKDEQKRAELVAEATPMNGMWARLVLRRVTSAANQKYVGKNLADIAKERDTTMVEAMIDLSLEEDLQAHFLAENLAHNDDKRVAELLVHPNVHIGASDGGAHILSFATYGDTGYLLSQFVRKTGLVGMEEAIKKITFDTARIWGMQNRGLLQVGYAADITIFDPETVARGNEYFVEDVPGDGNRYVRDAVGIECVVINGAVAFESATGYRDEHRGEILSGQMR